MATLLRDPRREDIAAMHRVRMSVRENVLVSGVITEAQYLAAIEVWGHGWVVEDEGEVIALAFADRRDGNIWALFVHPDHERRGHGRALHDVMMQWLWSQGLPRAWLSTDPGTRAQAFYQRAGWRFTGMLANGEAGYEMDRPEG